MSKGDNGVLISQPPALGSWGTYGNMCGGLRVIGYRGISGVWGYQGNTEGVYGGGRGAMGF